MLACSACELGAVAPSMIAPIILLMVGVIGFIKRKMRKSNGCDCCAKDSCQTNKK